MKATAIVQQTLECPCFFSLHLFERKLYANCRERWNWFCSWKLTKVSIKLTPNMFNCQGPYKLKEYVKEVILCQATISLKKMWPVNSTVHDFWFFIFFCFLQASPSFPSHIHSATFSSASDSYRSDTSQLGAVGALVYPGETMQITDWSIISGAATNVPAWHLAPVSYPPDCDTWI